MPPGMRLLRKLMSLCVEIGEVLRTRMYAADYGDLRFARDEYALWAKAPRRAVMQREALRDRMRLWTATRRAACAGPSRPDSRGLEKRKGRRMIRRPFTLSQLRLLARDLAAPPTGLGSALLDKFLERSRSPLIRIETTPIMSPVFSTNPCGSYSICRHDAGLVVAQAMEGHHAALLRPDRRMPCDALIGHLLIDDGIESTSLPAI